MKQKSPLTLNRILPPLLSLGLLFVFWRLNLKVMAVPIMLFVTFYYFVLPGMVRKKKEKFHRDALLLLTSGRAREVPALVRKNLLLQLTNQKAVIDAKLALAYVQLDQFGKAISGFERAIPEAPPTERLALEIGLVKALFATGEMARVRGVGNRVLEQTEGISELLVMVARARLALGETDEETRSLLARAEKLPGSADVDLMISLTRIELALKRNTKPPEIPEAADSKQAFLRAWLHFVRGSLQKKRGDIEKSNRSFTFASKQRGAGYFGDLARMELGEKASEIKKDEEKQPNIKHTKRRKRRR